MPYLSATVRLQFHKNFTLDDAIPLVSYFHQLGISHIYASPLLKARADSLHGYDVVDPTCINPELGGEEALQRLVAELRAHNMGLIVDMVSNHMAVGGADNPWWLDVLKWGLQSSYAHFFDIQWNSPDPLLKGQLLLPFLGSGYGDVLASGELKLKFDQDLGEFYVEYYSHRFPIYPPSYKHILRHTGHSSLINLADDFAALEGKRKTAATVHQALADLGQAPEVLRHISQALSLYEVTEDPSHQVNSNDDDSLNSSSSDVHPEWKENRNLQRLHQLLELQHYRLAAWNTAADDINWRRFFDVNELAGVRVERADVFEAIHGKIFELIEKGLIDGLRIDHVDGLAYPRTYCRRLRRRLDALGKKRPGNLADDHLPIFVEKILGHGEKLAQDWMVEGTTGYEFMNQVSLLQHDPHGELLLYDLWNRISGRPGTFKEEAKEARRLILASSLAGDVETVAQGLLTIARTDIATRDLTLGAIRRALVELIVHFPVYRTYASACDRAAQDKLFFDEALAGARTTLSEIDWSILDYLDTWLGGQPLRLLPPSPIRKLRKKILSRFQQLTSPAAAKAVEDTACYRSAVLLSRNDVGFDPQYFSAPLEQFHQQNLERAQTFPANLLATATHDHKRGEDTRARIAVISERAVWFTEKVEYWQNLSAPLRTRLEDGNAPSPGDELILYQILLGSWPLLSADTEDGIQQYLDRLLRWHEKALREAKLRTSWTAPNNDYETACRQFLTGVLTDKNYQELRDDIRLAADSLAPAGALNGLCQTLLRITSPGVPDLYQGADFWDFSLVDPDNRQPVDFNLRIEAIAKSVANMKLVKTWRNGHIKQQLIARALNARNQHQDIFAKGDYQILSVEGEEAERVIAFLRHYRGEYMLVVVPRFVASLLGDVALPHVPSAAWENTQLVLPSIFSTARFTSCLTQSHVVAHQSRIDLADALADFPVNLLYFNSSLAAATAH